MVLDERRRFGGVVMRDEMLFGRGSEECGVRANASFPQSRMARKSCVAVEV